MSNQTCMLVKNICYVAACILAITKLILGERAGAWGLWMMIAAVVFLIAGIIVSAVFYRCPHCGKPLPIKEKGLKFCPHCKGNLK